MNIKRKKFYLRIFFVSLSLVVLAFLFTSYLLNFKEKEIDEGFVSLTFDDGYESQYLLAAPILEKEGFNASFYVLAGEEIEDLTQSRMSFFQIRDLEKRGHEIGSHGLNHERLSSINDLKIINDEVYGSKQLLEKEGVTITSFAYPFGSKGPIASNLAKSHYQTIRGVGWGMNNFSELNLMELSSFLISEKDTYEEICDLAELAKTEKLWLILTYHDFVERAEGYSLPISHLDSLISCFKERQIKVKSVREAQEFLQKKAL